MATVLEPSVGGEFFTQHGNRWMNQAGGNWITFTHVQCVQDEMTILENFWNMIQRKNSIHSSRKLCFTEIGHQKKFFTLSLPMLPRVSGRLSKLMNPNGFETPRCMRQSLDGHTQGF